VNAQGQSVWRWDSAPFGDTEANEQPTGGIASLPLNLRFPGQQHDRETGTHYNYFRDYEAASGRYVQSDPIGLAGGVNSYKYVYARPLLGRDPLGLALTITSIRTGGVVHNDPNYPSPAKPGSSSNCKGRLGEAEMLAFVNTGGLPGVQQATRNTANNVAPPPGMSGNARTDGLATDSRRKKKYGLESKCGPCAGFTPHQNQNYGSAVNPPSGTAAQFDDIFTFWWY